MLCDVVRALQSISKSNRLPINTSISRCRRFSLRSVSISYSNLNWNFSPFFFAVNLFTFCADKRLHRITLILSAILSKCVCVFVEAMMNFGRTRNLKHFQNIFDVHLQAGHDIAMEYRRKMWTRRIKEQSTTSRRWR